LRAHAPRWWCSPASRPAAAPTPTRGKTAGRLRPEDRLTAGFSIVYGGAWEEQQRSTRDFTIAILLALALVYMVMAGQLSASSTRSCDVQHPGGAHRHHPDPAV
jgi:hypothetical protein